MGFLLFNLVQYKYSAIFREAPTEGPDAMTRILDDFPEFVRWYKEGMLDLDALVTKRWTLDQINEGVADLRAGNVFGRSIIEF